MAIVMVIMGIAKFWMPSSRLMKPQKRVLLKLDKRRFKNIDFKSARNDRFPKQGLYLRMNYTVCFRPRLGRTADFVNMGRLILKRNKTRQRVSRRRLSGFDSVYHCNARGITL
jgi:hypothetical protein